MPAERFFSRSSLNTSFVTLKDDEFHHLTKVMRVKEKEIVELIDGQGSIAKAEVESIEKKEATLRITSLFTDVAHYPELILAQALPRFSNLEWIVEKATELGATEIWIFPGFLSEKKEISPQQSLRLTTILQSALKQCGRLFIPKIVVKEPIAKWKALDGTVFFGDFSEKADWIKDPHPQKNTIVIGPEKGLHASEIAVLQNTLKAVPVKLHTNILRTETAGLVALSHITRLLS